MAKKQLIQLYSFFMELVLKRIAKKRDYTIGQLFIKEDVIDEYSTGEKLTYLCDTLEPVWRDFAHGAYKLKKGCAIPEGRYPVVITYSPKFNKDLPLVNAVKGFTGVRLHSGNTAKDTYGCILFGRNNVVGKVTNSRYWTKLIFDKIKKALDKGEIVKLAID